MYSSIAAVTSTVLLYTETIFMTLPEHRLLGWRQGGRSHRRLRATGTITGAHAVLLYHLQQHFLLLNE